MSTMPPGDQPPPPPPSAPQSATTPPWGNFPDTARLPIPGNAEFAFWLVVLILVALVCWISDSLGSPHWLDFAKWLSVAYVLSRGIAKASRVLEQ